MYKPQKFIFLISSVIFAGFLIIVFFNIYDEISEQKLFQKQRELPALGLAAYSRFNYIAAGYRAAGEKLLEKNIIRNWILAGEQDVEELITFMESVRAENHLLDASLVSDVTETYYGTDGRVLMLSPDNYERDGWYYHYRETAEETNIDSWFYPETGITGLYINIPIISDDGTFLGVTGGGIDAAVFDRLLKYFETEWDINLYIIRNDGHILYATKKDIINSGKDTVEKLWDSTVLDIITREKINEAGVVFEPVKGDDTLLWGGYISELETFLVIERSRDDLNKTISAAMRSSLLFNGGIVLIVFLISLFVLKYLFKLNYISMQTGFSYIHKLQSVVYIQSAIIQTSSRLLASVGDNSEFRNLSPIASEAAKISYNNNKMAAALKLPASRDSSVRQMEKINLNDLVNEIIFKYMPEAHRYGLKLVGQLPQHQLIVYSNEPLLRFCIEHILENNLNVLTADSQIFFVAGSHGDRVWLDIAFQQLEENRELFDYSILEPVFDMLKIKVFVRTDTPVSCILKVEFQPFGV